MTWNSSDAVLIRATPQGVDTSTFVVTGATLTKQPYVAPFPVSRIPRRDVVPIAEKPIILSSGVKVKSVRDNCGVRMIEGSQIRGLLGQVPCGVRW